jgi:hypothetical protein
MYPANIIGSILICNTIIFVTKIVIDIVKFKKKTRFAMSSQKRSVKNALK